MYILIACMSEHKGKLSGEKQTHWSPKLHLYEAWIIACQANFSTLCRIGVHTMNSF